MEQLVARKMWDLGQPQEFHTSRFGIGYDGAILRLQANTRSLAKFHLNGGGPRLRYPASIPQRVSCIYDGEVAFETEVTSDLVVHHIQPTNDGFLLICARSAWRHSGPDHNVFQYRWDGEFVASFCAGDGIEMAHVDQSQKLWTSYFDEGVFGNYGWGSPGPPPIGAPGAVRFNLSGAQEWTYELEAFDMYAMNVAYPDEAWFYHYNEFPLVRFKSGQYKTWNVEVRGARSIAADSDRCLLVGGYEQSKIASELWLNEDGRTSKARDVEFIDSSGNAIFGQSLGIGKSLYIWNEESVFLVDEW